MEHHLAHIHSQIDMQQLNDTIHQGFLTLAALKTVKTGQHGRKQVPMGLLHRGVESLDKAFPGHGYQIAKQILFIGKILIKASSRDSCPPNNLVNRRIGKLHPGKLLPGSLQKPIPLLFRQPQECLLTHAIPLF
ncbi:MAG: hypothetical protein V8R55_06265 [Dysosmobacter sp.]